MSYLTYIRFIGVLLFIFIVKYIDPQNIITSFKSINILYLILVVILMLPVFAIKSIRWKILTEKYNVSNSIKNYIIGVAIGISIGTVTPGRLGDFSRALYLRKKTNLPLNKSIITIIADRIEDVVILVLMAITGIMLLIYKFGNSLIAWRMLIASLIFLSILSITLTKKSLIRAILKPLFNKIIPEKHKENIGINFHEFYNYFNILLNDKVTILKTVLLTLSSWIIIFSQIYLIALSLNINIQYIYLIAILPITALIEIIPISISGIGTRDLVLIYTFSYFSLIPESAISLSIGILFINYLGTIPGFIMLTLGKCDYREKTKIIFLSYLPFN